ncbi:hypothetical protein CFAM422_012995 [Trichoderma lentiforme]|uniref:Toxin subunit n=1 Tax=Trichoderma lentiforme TaxID=1567552 RepID=A0A9P4X3Y3_9HYPO|nr:hypothetical protein CFAM422_012995 [Trichoderma lentiforme]
MVASPQTLQTPDTPMSLSKPQVDALCVELLPKVVIDDARLLSAIRTNLGITGSSFRGSIDAAVSVPGMQVSGGDRARLDLVLLLDDISGQSVDLIMFCFAGEASIGSCRQLATRIFALPAASPKVPSSTEASWARVREKLFGLEPTAAMLGLARSGSLPLPVNSDDSRIVLSVLETAAGSLNFDIARESMRRFLDGDAVRAEVPGVGDEQRQVSRDFLFRLQRLQALVNEPEDIGMLMKCGFRSADDISKTGNAAIQSMVVQGIPRQRATKIRNHAVVVAIRSEGLFTAALKARGSGDGRKSDALAAVSAPVSTAVVSQDDGDGEDPPPLPPLAPEINLSAMFKLENMGCSDCASITGPAAYYVDLLQTVAGIKLPDENKTSLLQKLFERRPDLGDLQLSCANTKILIPYIDLVNEVLESVIWYSKNGGDQIIPPFDMDDYDTCDNVITQPRHVNYAVYSDIVQKMVYPMTTSPYNLGTDSTRAYLAALGGSRYGLLSTFQSPHVVADPDGSLSDAQPVLDRALAAEALNLQHEDYVSISKEGFYPQDFLEAIDPTVTPQKYAQLIDLRTAGQYWGYAQDADMVATTGGLTNVKDQLLPRSGMNLKDLLDILMTRYIGGKLVIESVDGGPQFTGELADMRLRLLKPDGTTGPLDADICWRLQAFLRLRRKLQWKVDELDSIAVPLAGNRTTAFDPELLNGLAAVKQTADLSGLSPTELQPLWGDMNTHGPNSLYAQHFIWGPIPIAERPIFEPDENGNVLQGDCKISEHMLTLALALRVSTASLDAIVSTTKLTDRLTLPNVSFLYRVCFLSQLLDISPADYTALLSLYPASFDPFDSPKTTLAFVQEVRALLSAESNPWTLEQLLFVVKGQPGTPGGKYDLDVSKVLQMTVSMFTTLRASGLDSESGEAAEAASRRVQRTLKRLFGASVGAMVARYVNDCSLDKREEGEAMLLIKRYLTARVGPERAASFSSKLFSTIPEERRKQFIKAVAPIIPRTRERQIIMESVRPHAADIDSSILQFALSEIVRVPTLNQEALQSGMDVLLSLAENTELPDGNFDGYILPPNTDTYIISIDAETAPEALVLDGISIGFSEATGSSTRWEAKTGPLVEGRSYQLVLTGNVHEFQWIAQNMVGNPPASLSQELFVPKGVVADATAVLSRLIQVSDVISSLRLELGEVAFWQSNGVFDFNALTFQAIRNLQLYSGLKQEFAGLGATEPLLSLYRWLHNPTSRSGAVLSDLLSAVMARPKRICQDFLLAKYPGVDGKSGAEMMDIFKDIDAIVQMQESLKLMDKLGLQSISLSSLFTVAKPVRPPTISGDFDNAAILRLGLQSTFSGADVNGVKNALAVANDQIRSNSRDALVQCLLLEDYALEHQLTSADKLFAHFLIDVQMGSSLQTSRIKQAIATVQLFVQRCMLGAEKANGITGAVLMGRDDWDYVMQYRLWEANRKSFLYPENWLDPTLRDDKSQPFMAIESLILQMKLDGTGVRGIIEDYVREANEVANLQIETYLWERENKNDAKNYNARIHFFGRTRTSPPSYYYRYLDIGGAALVPIAYWMPWTAMNVGVSLQEMDQTGQRLARPGSYILPAKLGGRLYVFLPDITVGQRPLDDNNGNLTFEQFAQQKKLKDGQADLQWEIRLGYTEYRNGVWSAKKVSPSTIIILPDSRGAPLPDISSIKFWVDVTKLSPWDPKDPDAPEPPDNLVVRVERVGQANAKASVQVLGQYQLRGQHLLLIDNDGLPVSNWTQPAGAANATMQTTFSKHSWLAPAQSDNEATKSDIYNGSRVVKPWLAYLGRGDKAQYDWTMSLDTVNNDAPTGFVYDVSRVDGTETYFAFPPFMANPNNPEQAVYFNERFYDVVSPLLMNAVNNAAGLDALYGVFSQLPKEAYSDAFGQRNSKISHEKSTPFAIYNWEVGVHIPSLLMERLMATQQFELALDVARLAFDPSADGDRVDRPWKFPPFKDEQIRTGKGPDFDLEWKKKMSTDEWRANSFSVHAAARGNPVSYMKRIAMKYIEILIAAGDHYFRQNSLETVPLALQHYIEASQVFGPPPVELPALGKRAVKSYNQIAKDLDVMSNATVDMELELPFYSEPGNRGNTNMEGRAPLGFIRTEYFCLPGNPFVVDLRTMIDDRLYKIRNGLNIDGVKRTLALWEPPIDPAVVVRANALRAMAGLAPPGADPEAPVPKYRFSYVVGRAHQVAKQLKETESRLLMIKEKKDAAALAALQVEHRKTLAGLSKSIAEGQKSVYQQQIDLLKQERKTQEMILKHNIQLTGDSKAAPKTDESWEDIPQEYTTLPSNEFRMSRYENDEVSNMKSSGAASVAANSLRTIAGILNAIPFTYIHTQPVGVGMSCAFSGSQAAAITESFVSIAEATAASYTNKANIAALQSGAEQRLQQRRLDANMAGRNIENIDMQIAQITANLSSHEMTMKVEQEMVDSAEAEAKWLQSKYSNEELYSSLDNSLGALLYQTYITGKEMAAKAQEMLDREKPGTRSARTKANQGSGTSFLDRAVQSGHLLGEALALDLARLEAADMEDPEADAEVQKTISLRQLDPLALLELRESGTASFRLPESVFDMDFPGHYYRRIVSVGMSVPCVADRHTSLNCTLSLRSHRYRVTPQARDADTYNDAADDNGGVDASAFRTDRIPIASVAVGTCTIPSTGTVQQQKQQQQQQQQVELNFSPGSGGNKDKYGPFEGAGAISDWHIRLPSAVRPFDYDTISDVLLHIKYTAFDGGDDFRQTSESALLKRLATAEGSASVMSIELASEYPNEWQSCVASSNDSTATLDLSSLRSALPYWAQRARAKAENVMLLVTPKPAAAALNKMDLELRTSPSNTVKLVANGALKAGGHAALVSQSAAGDVTNDWKIVGLGGNSSVTQAWLLIQYTVTGLKR